MFSLEPLNLISASYCGDKKCQTSEADNYVLRTPQQPCKGMPVLSEIGLSPVFINQAAKKAQIYGQLS